MPWRQLLQPLLSVAGEGTEQLGKELDTSRAGWAVQVQATEDPSE